MQGDSGQLVPSHAAEGALRVPLPCEVRRKLLQTQRGQRGHEARVDVRRVRHGRQAAYFMNVSARAARPL